jgi:hypothetical protein
MRFGAKGRAAEEGDYAVFVGSETNRSLWSRFLVRQTDRRSVTEGDSPKSDR